jgi:hypothetical protein
MSTTTAGAMLGTTYEVPEEERAVAGSRKKESYTDLVRRLSHQSVVKHFDAYADIAWDDPEFAIDPEDPRWELSTDDVLGGTAWYQSQPPAIRARIGLHMMATFMKIGLQFEGVLKRGLLEFALKLPNNSPEFRYAYHEVIEEAQHSLMFQEFVNRSGFDIPGLSWWQRFGGNQVVRLGRRFPELFFVFVLGGEDPIDHVQRQALRSNRGLHPLLKRVMQIHVTEEARHLCFARQYLREHAAEMTPFRKWLMSRRAPIILAIMAQMMMRPSSQIVKTYGIPRSVLREAYGKNPVHKARTLEALRKVRELLVEIGVVTPSSKRIWKLLGVWEPTTA